MLPILMDISPRLPDTGYLTRTVPQLIVYIGFPVLLALIAVRIIAGLLRRKRTAAGTQSGEETRGGSRILNVLIIAAAAVWVIALLVLLCTASAAGL